jgi:chromosome segregation ATPase
MRLLKTVLLSSTLFLTNAFSSDAVHSEHTASSVVSTRVHQEHVEKMKNIGISLLRTLAGNNSTPPEVTVNSDLSAIYMALAKKCQETVGEKEKLESDLSSTKSNVTLLTATNQEIKKEIEDLQKTNRELTEALTKATDALREKENEVSNANAKLNDEIKNLNDEIKNLKETIQTLQKKITSNQADVDSILNPHNEEVNREIESLDALLVMLTQAEAPNPQSSEATAASSVTDATNPQSPEAAKTKSKNSKKGGK